MALAIPRHFDLTLTQGGADAFVEGEILTELVPADGLPYVITRAEFQLEQAMPVANGANVEWSICRDTKAAVAPISDPDCFYSNQIWEVAAGATQIWIQDLRHEVSFPAGLFVVEPSIWVQLDSGSTGLSNVMHCRLWYEQQKLSEVEILRLLNNI